MELVEGPTLADRIARGAIPIDEALPIARQVAEALEAAHDRGIVHRDLKPANIKIREDGAVKVLDFGLATAILPESAPSADPTSSPPLDAVATADDVIFGTAAYMSPEQARGRRVDKRADLWAFGAVLYEMLTGRRAFEGEHVADTLASRADEGAGLAGPSVRHAAPHPQAPPPMPGEGSQGTARFGRQRAAGHRRRDRVSGGRASRTATGARP